MRAAALLLVLFAALSSARAADHLTVLLDWFVNPDHAPILVAQQIGAYAAEDWTSRSWHRRTPPCRPNSWLPATAISR